MSDMEKAYSDYMSKKSAVWSQIAELWQGLYLRVEPHLMDIFKAGYTAAQSQSGWVMGLDAPVDTWVEFAVMTGSKTSISMPHRMMEGDAEMFQGSDSYAYAWRSRNAPPSPKEQI